MCSPVWRKLDDLLVPGDDDDDEEGEGEGRCALPMLRKVEIEVRFVFTPPTSAVWTQGKAKMEEMRRGLEQFLGETFLCLEALMQRGELELKRVVS